MLYNAEYSSLSYKIGAVVKLLFTVPHFYKSLGYEYGSNSSPPQVRINALSELILALHQQFGPLHCELNHENGINRFPIAELPKHDITIKICTTDDSHLLSQLPIPEHLYTHYPTSAKSLLLGFECHHILREHLGQYDYYCFLEDDLIIRDALFFEKLKAFNQMFGPENLLQPNRYELSAASPFIKLYLDGPLPVGYSDRFQDITVQPHLQLPLFGTYVNLQRPVNPHAGCFFLTQEQMQHWAKQPYFLDRDVSFVGLSEGPANAATLGIMKTFRVYKPVANSTNFLEVLHSDPRFVQQFQ